MSEKDIDFLKQLVDEVKNLTSLDDEDNDIQKELEDKFEEAPESVGSKAVRGILIKAIQKLDEQKADSTTVKTTVETVKTIQQSLDSLKQELEDIKKQGQSFFFNVVTVNREGKIIQDHQRAAKFFTEEKIPLTEGKISLHMVAIPEGRFTRGAPQSEKESSSSERPQRLVTIKPFYMGKFPVTQAQWKAIANLPNIDRDLESDPSEFKGDNRPVEKVSWDDAVEFCKRLSKETGREYRLPSEAEWEYAARAGTTTPFHFGETITSELANYESTVIYANEPRGKNRAETTPVGIFPPNNFGLYDMHGNVFEWCADTWYFNYKDAPTDGSAWISDDESATKVVRGGSWKNKPNNCRSAVRGYNYRDIRISDFGFRVVCSRPRT